jgi:poly(3-hydroxybutyrate) depolymerase
MKIPARLRHLLAALAAVAFLAATPSAVDTAFKSFWDAPGPREAAATVDGILKTNVAFDDAYARLKRGREYPAQAPRGVVRGSHHFAAGDFGYTIEVPDTYTPSHKYQVRVQLHGGVMGRTDGNIRGSGSIGSLAGAEQIYVMPNSWQDAPWWSDAQIENMRAILDDLKRAYNVDENRVVLSGVSDGATANYYFAMRDTTPFASFLTLNGALAVLQNDSLGIRAELFPQNLVNKPFFMVNGARDPLYPAELVEPYIEHLAQGGVEVLYHQRPEGVHNTGWWPEEKGAFETFVREHPRRPFPDHLTWETDMTADTNRAHWLVINGLAKTAGTTLKPDLNEFSTDLLGRFGLKVQGTTVVRVVGSSSASTFFLEPGDVITAVHGQAVTKESNLDDVLAHVPEGRLTIVVSRGGKPLDLSGFFRVGAPTAIALFSHAAPSGRVDLTRDGNTVRAATSGVAEFTLLVSPDVFDFSKPIIVVAGGKTVFNGRVARSVATLMKWAAKDNDRTMLFGAEIDVKLPR